MATLTYRDAVGRALQDSLREDPRLIFIGQNIAGYTLKQMAEEFGESRIRDTSISESAMVGMAVGAAMKGWKAVVMIAYADISSVCHKAIVQSAAKMHYLTCGRLRCPVVIRLPIARFRGHGPMGNEVAVSWFYNVPDLNIVMPLPPMRLTGVFAMPCSARRLRYFLKIGRFTTVREKSLLPIPAPKRA
jgi:acetoin:2,6-dichlorophenolindophenol oxidoreductase subunit beta